MFLICSVWESDHVEDVCGRSRGFGVDFAVYRDDRGVGAGDPAALRLVARTGPMRPSRRPLGISRMARAQGSFRVDSARPRHHHRGPRESAFWEARASLEGLTIAPTYDVRAVQSPCPMPDSSISTFIRPIRC